jgi:hypothetical protein
MKPEQTAVQRMQPPARSVHVRWPPGAIGLRGEAEFRRGNRAGRTPLTPYAGRS